MSVSLKSFSWSSDLEPETVCRQDKGETQTNNILKSLGYQVVDHLGEGGSGQVKLATAERHPKPVAIKILDPQHPECVRQELAILKTVRHPNIIQVHEIFEMPNRQAFIVMEAAKMDLECRMIEEIPINTVRLWFSQLLSAVAYLHQQDIAHRDLKCSNVLLTDEGRIKLSDFGIACFSKGFPELCDTYCCTPCYAAPEVLKFTPYDPKKSDVWSLGVILYEMVTGTLPFEGTSYFPMEEPCRSIIRSMLNSEPSERPSVEELVRHPWLQSTPEWSDMSLECSVHVQGWEESRPIRVTYTVCKAPHPPAARANGTYVVTVTDEDEGTTSPEDINPPQEDDGGESRKHGCFNSSAVKRAVKAFIVAPILRASRSLRRRMKVFSESNVVHDISSTSQQDANYSAACSEAPARRLRFPKFKKILMMKKIHPSS